MKESTKNGIDLYVTHGLPPGDFLYAVLTNDLLKSFQKADYENSEDLPEIVRYVYNEIPAIAWGSEERVEEWLEMHREKRRKHEEVYGV